MRLARSNSATAHPNWRRGGAVALLGTLLVVTGAALAAVTSVATALPTALWTLVGISAALGSTLLGRRQLRPLFVWLESFGKPDLNAEGRNVGRTANLRDVTDHERATASLHKNLRILDSVAHISGIGGWSLELVIRFFAPEAQPLITQAIAAGIEHSKPWKLELPLIIATGRQIWLRASGEVEREHGRATNLLGCIRCDRHVDSTSAGILRRHP